MLDKQVIAYFPRQLKVYEKNYHTYDLELVVVIFALKNWKHYLYGVHCEVFTDNRSLQHMFRQRDLKLRWYRWIELLKNYHVIISYHPGKANMVADTLIKKYESMGSLAYLKVLRRPLAREVHSLANCLMRLELPKSSGVLARVEVRSSLLDRIKAR